VSVQNPARVSDLTEPQPDLMLLRPLGRVYRTRTPRPEDVLLLIEVSDSSARFDRQVKRPLYAAAGIVEVWIVDLEASLVEVATLPSAEGYRDVREVRPGRFAVPGAFPDLALPATEIVT
jgi:Uma2 family endonuclease